MTNLHEYKLTLNDPDMGLWSYAYDALGNLTRQTDARGQRICLYYDGLNRLTGKHYRADDACPSSPTYNVSYGYDSGTNGIGRRTSMTDTSGSTSWTFDQRGRAITETRNLTGIGTFNTAWSYNSADLLAGMQYPENNSGGLSTQVASTYLPQMTLNTLGSFVTGTIYDATGRITSRLLGGSGLRQDFAYTTWDAQFQGGKLDKIEAGTNAPDYNNLQDLDYGYDKIGNILTILDATNSSQQQCFTYDALNRLTRGTTTNDTENGCGSTQLGNGNYDQSYTYDTTTGNLGSKAGVGYTYGDTNHDHAVTRVDDDSPATSTTITIRAKKINTSGVTTHPTMYLYIDGQQVASWSVSRTYYYNYSTTQTISSNEQIDVVCSNCSSSIQLDIDYVTVGTQTVQAEGAATLLDLGTGTYAFDWQNVSKPTTGIIVEPGALRFVVGNNAFSGAYDANGNLIYRLVNGLATIMTYDAENHLTNVTGTASATSAFVYDGDGNRVKSTINTTNPVTTAFIGNHTEWDVSSSSLTRYYYAESTRVAMRKNNTVYYLLSDYLGSTSLTTDENGQNPVKQLYLPWGEVRYSSGSLQTKYTYTGQYSNVTDFGLMYYNARWYDSLLGRFTQADTMVPQPGNPMAWDRFAYTLNNPVNFTDPSGNKACDGENSGSNVCDQISKEDLLRLMKLLYGWRAYGKFTIFELDSIVNAGERIADYITTLTGGWGQGWVRSHLGNAYFHRGGLPTISANALEATAFVLPISDVIIGNHGFNSSDIIHELGHVLDNNEAGGLATFFGGGPADEMVKAMGGNPSGCFPRFKCADFETGVLPRFHDKKWYRDNIAGNDTWSEKAYANTGVSEDFAETFTWTILSIDVVPSARSVWMTNYMQSLLP
jgi:RHS repeat-associated protein